MAADKQVAGTPNVLYNVVSVLYHALQGADTYEQFAKDTEQSGDIDLARFFRSAAKANEDLGEKAKGILKIRLGD